jgi:acyl carrier protein
MAMLNTNSKSEIVFRTIVDMLTPERSRPEFKGGFNASTQLSEVGLIDSTHLLDIILEVEQRCAVEFDPTRVDFQEALTLGSLVSAFITP